MHMGAVTIQQAKKGVRLQKNNFKILKICKFYYLKPWQSWQSWQVVTFSFIWMSKIQTKNPFDKFFNLGFNFWTFECEHLFY
jgi:hypothetical protein